MFFHVPRFCSFFHVFFMFFFVPLLLFSLFLFVHCCFDFPRVVHVFHHVSLFFHVPRFFYFFCSACFSCLIIFVKLLALTPAASHHR